MFKPHPWNRNYSACGDTGQIKTPQGIKRTIVKYVNFKHDKTPVGIPTARFIYECYNGLIATDHVVMLINEALPMILSNLQLMTQADAKQHRQAVQDQKRISEKDEIELDSIIDKTCFERDGWKSHDSFENYMGNENGDIINVKTRKILKGQLKKSGFIAMYLTDGATSKYIPKHQFIFECFNGILTPVKSIIHIDGNESNNMLCNLSIEVLQTSAHQFVDGTWYPHPVYKTHAANTQGQIKNLQNKALYKLSPSASGYVEHRIRNKGQKEICLLAHRFIYECFYGLIKPKYEVDHINSIKHDNSINNLQTLSNRDHRKKTRAENPMISLKRASTVSKTIIRFKKDKNVEIDHEQFDSSSDAAKTIGKNCKVNGIREAIKFAKIYYGYYWKYKPLVFVEGEEWKSVRLSDSVLITVSNLGRIKTSYGLSEGCKTESGYKKIGFADKTYLVHTLICLAFHGLPQEMAENATVDHINKNRSDNRAINIRWTDEHTQGLNRKGVREVYGYLINRPNHIFGPYPSVRDAGKALKIDYSSISAVINKRRISAGSFNGNKIGWKV